MQKPDQRLCSKVKGMPTFERRHFHFNFPATKILVVFCKRKIVSETLYVVFYVISF
ncbi:hypothetical protein HMPREF9074_07769 [Capnocytophaga sp. oral taxon 329 str. F0087]|nr:hypothetical protein HMPREF9074_07769 [Capnocytophaga sp. oral taxon 329 str. F0087]